jgi:hypothetical protein
VAHRSRSKRHMRQLVRRLSFSLIRSAVSLSFEWSPRHSYCFGWCLRKGRFLPCPTISRCEIPHSYFAAAPTGILLRPLKYWARWAYCRFCMLSYSGSNLPLMNSLHLCRCRNGFQKANRVKDYERPSLTRKVHQTLVAVLLSCCLRWESLTLHLVAWPAADLLVMASQGSISMRHFCQAPQCTKWIFCTKALHPLMDDQLSTACDRLLQSNASATKRSAS